jgi:hypothetical protein
MDPLAPARSVLLFLAHAFCKWDLTAKDAKYAKRHKTFQPQMDTGETQIKNICENLCPSVAKTLAFLVHPPQ